MGKKVQQLEKQVGETQKTVAEGKAVSGAQVQPIAPVPSGPLALHNFVITGDAEVQFGKTQGQHSAFTLADLAPIFLFRANDNILFEAGFDVRLQNGSVTLANGQTGNSGTTTTIDLSFAKRNHWAFTGIKALCCYAVETIFDARYCAVLMMMLVSALVLPITLRVHAGHHAAHVHPGLLVGAHHLCHLLMGGFSLFDQFGHHCGNCIQFLIG